LVKGEPLIDPVAISEGRGEIGMGGKPLRTMEMRPDAGDEEDWNLVLARFNVDIRSRHEETGIG
jgi:hypothetical protein